MAFDLYLDTSALVKLYVREPETVELSTFVRRHAPPLPYSSLHELELTHALERRREEGDLTVVDVTRITVALEKDLEGGVLARPEADWPGVFTRAIHLLRQHRGLRSLDALHIGQALECGAGWFITYDKRQAKAAAPRRRRRTVSVSTRVSRRVSARCYAKIARASAMAAFARSVCTGGSRRKTNGCAFRSSAQ